MLEEFGGHVFVNRVGLRQFKRHRKHRQTVKAHPRRAVRLLQESSSRERLRPIEHPNVIKAEKTAGKEIITLSVLPIHPPREVEQ